LEEILRAIGTRTQHTYSELSREDLVDNYNEAVWQFCRSITFSKEDAEDLMQETFLKVFEQMNKINASENPKSFLFSTALYLWKSKKRKYARRDRIVPIVHIDDDVLEQGDNGIEDGIIVQEDIKIVQKVVESLPEKIKIPIILYYTMEMNQTDIAAMLKLPVGTIKSRLHTARKIIEKGLMEVGYGE